MAWSLISVAVVLLCLKTVALFNPPVLFKLHFKENFIFISPRKAFYLKPGISTQSGNSKYNCTCRLSPGRGFFGVMHDTKSLQHVPGCTWGSFWWDVPGTPAERGVRDVRNQKKMSWLPNLTPRHISNTPVWCGGCSTSDWRIVRRMVRTAESILRAPLPFI